MNEPVLISERVAVGIRLGESHFREFKSAQHGPAEKKTARTARSVCEDIAQTLVAFANADGGELYVGVEDDGTVTGVPESAVKDIDQMLDAPRSHVLSKTPLPNLAKHRIAIDGKAILFFKVSAGYDYIYQTADGRCLQRRDLESIPISVEHVQFDRQEARSRTYERDFIDGATVEALDFGLIDFLIEEFMPGIHREKCLQLLDLADFTDTGLRLRRAALLLFAKEAERWHPRLQVRVLRVVGTELKSGDDYNVTNDEIVSTSVLGLVEAAWGALRPHLVQTRFGAGARFQTTYIYPEDACREAVVNAIAHRDYSLEGRGIEIYVFDDRMEVKSPGALLSSITIETLKKLEGVHQSRNALIARVLREVGYMRELGEGLRRIFHLMRGSELLEPDLRNGADFFSITLHHEQMYTAAEKAWLEQFSSLELDKTQRAVIVLGRGGKIIAPNDIMESLGIVDTEVYRQVISSLQQLGIISRAVTDNQVFYQSKRQGLPKRSVPCWKITPPGSIPVGARTAPVDVPASPRRALLVQNIPYRLRNSDLFEFLSSFGEISDLRIPRGYHGTKGYCFVDYVTDGGAEALAAAAVSGLQFDGRQLMVKPVRPRSERRYDRKV